METSHTVLWKVGLDIRMAMQASARKAVPARIYNPYNTGKRQERLGIYSANYNLKIENLKIYDVCEKLNYKHHKIMNI